MGHAGASSIVRLVDVHALDGTSEGRAAVASVCGPAADGVVKDEDARGTGSSPDYCQLSAGFT